MIEIGILPKNKLADAAAVHLPQGATKSIIVTQSFFKTLSSIARLR